MKLFKRSLSAVLALVMAMSVFCVNSFAATVTKMEIVEVPDKTTFYYGTDWDYGFWRFPEGATSGTFVPKEGLITMKHQGGKFSRYEDRGLLDMNGLVVKVTYSDGKTKNVAYKEVVNSANYVEQNLYFSPQGGDFKLGENVIEVYFLSSPDVYTTYKINIVDVLLGDVDFNGKVNSTDALIVLQSSVKLVTLTEKQISVADMNSDNKVNSVDALKILKKSVGLL